MRILLIGICFASLPATAQKYPLVPLSHDDSAKVKALYQRAFSLPTHSAKRQATLDSILMIRHDLSYAWQQKAMPLLKQMKYEIAMPYLDSAVKYCNTYQWLEYRGYIKCIFQKSYREALGDLRLSETRNPGGVVMDHTYDFYSGLCYLQLNKPDSAEQYIRRSIAAGIKRVGAGHHLEYLYLGIVLREQGRLIESIAEFDKALKAYPRFSDAKYYKAQCLKDLRNDAAADALLAEASRDLKAGYTINEDNVIYETYPYQLRSNWLHSVK